MDYAQGEMSPFLATGKKVISPKALSTLRVMAFLGPRSLHNSLFEPLRSLFTAKNEELKFNFPTTVEAYKKACTELMKASLLQLNKTDTTYTIRPEIQSSVLADTHTAGLIPPLFNATVKVVTRLWPQMVCIPDRTVGQEEYSAATAPNTNYETYLEKRYSESRLPPFQEYLQYANLNVWGRRDELVHHIGRLEHIFFHLDDDMIDVCATVTFATLLIEAAWYYIERSRYHDAKVKIESALGVYELGRAKSSLHHASICRVHAAIALENGKFDEAARYVTLQLEQLGLHGTAQGDTLRKSGLLDRAPDAIFLSSWGRDVLPGIFVVLPFRSICNFGFKLYLSAHDERDREYPQYLHQAETCFLTALKDCQQAHTKTARTKSRMGELYYALGNVANKQASFLGKAHFYQSLEYFETALQYLSSATTNDNDPAPGIAKTHYKLAIQFVQIQDYRSATHHIDQAMAFYASDPTYKPHLARLLYQKSRIQTLTGDPNARATLHSAFAIRVSFRGGVRLNEKRFAEELSEADFDELIGIWER